MEFKSKIVRKAIETDEATYVRVLADQICDMPIIPKKYPIRQLKWKVSLDKGTVYIPKDGIFCRTLEVGYGSIVNSNVFSKESIKIESGKSSKGCTLINGSIISEGNVQILKPSSKEEDYEDGPSIVKGNVIGDRIEINAPLVVFGIIIGEEIIINDWTFAIGVVSKKLMAQKLTSVYILAEQIEFGDLVSVFIPFIVSKDIQFNEVRIINLTCKKCEEEGKDIVQCNFKECDRCTTLNRDDIIEIGDYKVVTTAWRTFKESDENINWLKERLYDFCQQRYKLVEPDKLRYTDLSKDLKVELNIEV